MYNTYILKHEHVFEGVGPGQSVEQWTTCRTVWVEFLTWQDFTLSLNVQTNSGAHPAYLVGTGYDCPGGKVTRALSCPLTSI
jgi:hypothetical protein